MPSRNASLNLLKKCEYIAPGQIGVCRKSMLSRETLQRPKIGEPLTRGRPKQPKDFVYGLNPPFRYNEIVDCFNWPTRKTGDHIDPDCLPRDFHRINVESTKEGIHPVPDWLKFADEKNYRLNPTKRVLGRLRKPKFPEEMIFGRAARPQTPMQCIMSHRYKTMWDEHALEENKKRMASMARSQNDIPHPLDSVSSVLNMVPIGTRERSTQRDQPPSKLWQMKRFQKQSTRLDTRWSEEQAKRLLRGV
ncbi:hypothetical protein CSKR_110844 [Clonorchis sinensis]|uniref:Uncharacterized protein n=2 Tax=Clonorchis sinensis TaxID=79923 RepID=A0A8T1MV55_CLOSI|nr:hypothetical protein CSKR_110844 [Clonorchis sinensis]GAA53588.1 hypothetical protein CLF_110580 [Clonorchis sinensis]